MCTIYVGPSRNRVPQRALISGWLSPGQRARVRSKRGPLLIRRNRFSNFLSWTRLLLNIKHIVVKNNNGSSDTAGNTEMKHKVQAERRTEFINWARTTFEDNRVAESSKSQPDAEDRQQLTYHDASVCPVMSDSSPAISEFSLDQCSFLADWFHR